MDLFNSLSSFVNPLYFDAFILKLSFTLISVISLWLTHNFIVILIKRQFKNNENIYATRRISLYFHFLLGVLIIGQLWFDGLQSLGTFLGLFTAGLAIALKDVVTNFAGWIYLMWQTPFKIGDRVQINDHQGDVIDMGVFKFTLLEIGNWVDANQSTGRLIRIPNADIFNQPIANYSKGFNYIWYEIPIILTFESDWKKAKELFHEIISSYFDTYHDQLKRELKKAKKDYPINYNHVTPIIYTSTVDQGIRLTLRYMVQTRKIRESDHEIWESILNLLDKHKDLELAYPTIRHLN